MNDNNELVAIYSAGSGNDETAYNGVQFKLGFSIKGQAIDSGWFFTVEELAASLVVDEPKNKQSKLMDK